jgi:autophagy-related protein 9
LVMRWVRMVQPVTWMRQGRGRFTDTCNRFVAFIAGSFAAVLLVASLIDPDLFLHFEITPHRTVLFYLGVFGSILAIARGMVPEENLVFDPEASLREVVRWTHYLPGEWRGKLHSQMVRSTGSSPRLRFRFRG